jgi:hypothetical protein
MNQLDLKELEAKTSEEFVSKVKYRYEILTKCLPEGRTVKVKVDDFHNDTIVFLTDGANCHVLQVSSYGTIDHYHMPIYFAREFVNQLAVSESLEA